MVLLYSALHQSPKALITITIITATCTILSAADNLIIIPDDSYLRSSWHLFQRQFVFLFATINRLLVRYSLSPFGGCGGAFIR